MALSIRNPQAERLACEVAARSGENMTQAIIKSLQERLQRLIDEQQSAARLEELQRIAARCQSLPDQDPSSADEILGYDENGVCR